MSELALCPGAAKSNGVRVGLPPECDARSKVVLLRSAAVVDPDAKAYKPEPRFDLAACFANALPVLTPLVQRCNEANLLIAACAMDGFPLALRRVTPTAELPLALVAGRHPRCSLQLPDESRASLRHLLLSLSGTPNAFRLRGRDLGGRAGLILADGARVPAFSAPGRLAVAIGQIALFVIPGGEVGREITQGDAARCFERLTGVDPSGKAGARLAVTAVARPGAAELGGYRSPADGSAPKALGSLRLRATKAARGEANSTRELEVDEDQLTRGLLIGRYSDRCSLAGSGRNLSRVHALVELETNDSLLVYDLASTNGVRPRDRPDDPGHDVVRITPSKSCLLGHFELSWQPATPPLVA